MYKTILLPVDLNDPTTGKKALATAAALAKTFGSELHVLAVVPNFGMSVVGGFFPQDFEEKALEKVKTDLAAFMDAELDPSLDATGHVAHGSIYEEILHAAKALSADLIVVGAHRPELKDYLLGPNAARVVRHAPQSVMVVRD
ncbi:universal stress protein [Amorphus orientalis]|uniref:Nucleotide-binding universal stress UspA family protein n=1 Tax=Amorphus orientalis TaxID=649198 RepID=A0AAE3VRJ0_9HYPH|nr:universal stress protein [Amorphus orientalis]MDQ0316816.1 nucleotide-binding universal stress UspA family protein [Amorphus orientalis]